MPPLEGNNDKGFFEDLDINHLNERALKKIGASWDQLAPIEDDDLEGPILYEERRDACLLLSQKTRSGKVFGFKDPRTTVLLPFWQAVFEDLGIEPFYVVAVRNPLEVAESLRVRDGFPIAKGVWLWTKHMHGAVNGSIGARNIFVSFEKLLGDPMVELERLAAALNLPAPDVADQEIAAFLNQFLENGLRHAIVGAGELKRSGAVPQYVEELYDILVDLSNDEVVDATQRLKMILETARNEMSALAEPLALVDRSEEMRIATAKQLSLREGELNSKMKRLDAATAALERAAGERDAAVKERVEERTRLTAKIKSVVEEREQLSIRLTEERARMMSKIDSIVAEREKLSSRIVEERKRLEAKILEERASINALSAKKAEIENTHNELAEAFALLKRSSEAEITQIKSEFEEAATDLKLARERAGKIERDLEKLRREHREKTAALRSRSAEVEIEKRRVQELNVRLNSTAKARVADKKSASREILLLRAEVRELRESFSWRISAPVRVLSRALRRLLT